MCVDIFNKILLFFFFLSALNVIRTSFFLVRTIIEKERFTISNRALVILGISISFILLSIIDGIKL